MTILLFRYADRKAGWVFPSRHKGERITGGLVNKQWVRARKKAGLPEDHVLYPHAMISAHMYCRKPATSPQS